MKFKVKAVWTVLCLLVLSVNSSAQKPGWKIETTKDGRVSVSYQFSEFEDQSGKKLYLWEYEAVTSGLATLENCKKVMMDDPKHMEFTSTNGTFKGRWNFDSPDEPTEIQYHFPNEEINDFALDLVSLEENVLELSWYEGAIATFEPY